MSHTDSNSLVGSFIFPLRMSQKITLHLAFDSVFGSTRFALFRFKLVTEVAFPRKHLPSSGCRVQQLQLPTHHPGPHPLNSYFLQAGAQGPEFLANTLVILRLVVGRTYFETSWYGKKVALQSLCGLVPFISWVRPVNQPCGCRWLTSGLEPMKSPHLLGISSAWRDVMGTENPPKYKTQLRSRGAWTALYLHKVRAVINIT